MALVVKRLEGEWVTLKCDTAEKPEDKTKFFIRPLTFYESALISDKHSYTSLKDGKTYWNSGHQSMEVLHAGVLDVENLRDPDGNVVVPPKETVRVAGRDVQRIKRDFFEVFPSEVVGELVSIISATSTLTKDEVEDINFTKE